MATIKIHSTLQHLTDLKEYNVDIKTYDEVLNYLCATQPKFDRYTKNIKTGSTLDNISLVNEKFVAITSDVYNLKYLKDKDIVYVVPAIYGGGGKRGFLFFAIFAAFAIFALPALAGSAAVGAAGAAGGAAGGAAVGAAGGAAGGGFFSQLGAAFSALPGFAKSLIGNLAINVMTGLFTRKSKTTPQAEDSVTRNNDMFGNLNNTTSSNTPLSLIYGHHRVAGQFISGYIDTVEQSNATDNVDVGDFF